MRRTFGILGLVVVAALTFVSIGAGAVTVRHCKASDLKLSQGPEQSGTAHFRQVVAVRNVSMASCSMSGWFTVKLLNAHGKALASHEQRITSDFFGISHKRLVILKPGGHASFAIDTTAPATSCPFSKTIAATPPSGHGSAKLKLRIQACPKFSVLPVQPDDKALA